MVDYTNLLLMLGTTYLIYLVLHRNYPWLAGMGYLGTGLSSYLIQSSNNPFGIIIMVLGVATILTTPLGSSR